MTTSFAGGYVVLKDFTLRLESIVSVDAANYSLTIEYATGTTARIATIPLVSEHELYAIHSQLTLALSMDAQRTGDRWVTFGTKTLRRSAIVFINTQRPRKRRFIVVVAEYALHIDYCVGSEPRSLLVPAPDRRAVVTMRKTLIGDDALFCGVLSYAAVRRDAIAIVSIDGTVPSLGAVTVVYALGTETRLSTLTTGSLPFHERCHYNLLEAMYEQSPALDCVTIGTTTMRRSSIISVLLAARSESMLIVEYVVGPAASTSFSLNLYTRSARDAVYCSLAFSTPGAVPPKGGNPPKGNDSGGLRGMESPSLYEGGECLLSYEESAHICEEHERSDSVSPSALILTSHPPQQPSL